MRVYSDDAPAPPDLRGAAIALGNFDGVHKGHQAVIAAAGAVARARGLKLAAAVFEPHPRQVLRPNDPPFRIQTSAQRARALAAAGVEIVFQIGFDRALAALSDADFARVVLAERFGAAHIETGFDFTFGRAKMGNLASLKAHGEQLGFTTGYVQAVATGGEKISSSAIRTAIGDGRVEDGAALLGRPWAVEAEVINGAQLGRTLGYPTANQALGAYVRPRFGVYAVMAKLDGQHLPGVASCGVRPTVTEAGEPLLETYLFDFTGDLYGRLIEVELVKFLRPEAKFDSLDAMKAQIDRDAAEARAALR